MRWLCAVQALPVIVIVGFYLGRQVGGRTAQVASAGSAAGPCASSAAVTTGTIPCAQPLLDAAIPSPSASASPSASPSATPTKSAAPATHLASPAPARSPVVPVGSQQGAPADQVLAVINQARAAAGLPAYTFTSGLDLSSSRHNTVMASGCGLSHQCSGEASLGARESVAGVNWTAAGENIGEGGPVSASTSAITQMAVTLTKDMIAEKPPDDGHRMNILSTSYHHIGIAVFRDSSGTVWLTQDFSN
jgi:uncharacterized protein YkwD